MRNSFVMKVVEGLSYLLEESVADWLFYLAVGTLLLDVLVKTYAANVISHDANCL